MPFWLLFAAGAVILLGGSAVAAERALVSPSSGDVSLSDASLVLTAPAQRGGEAVPVYQTGDGTVCYRSRFSVDTDGVGDAGGDQTHLSDVAWGGRGIDASVVNYITLVPQIYQPLSIGLGCLGVVCDLSTGSVVGCVVADRGGQGNHAGEGSAAAAAAIGLPNGTARARIGWVVFPNSGDRNSLSVTYQQEAEALFADWGGLDKLLSIVGAG